MTEFISVAADFPAITICNVNKHKRTEMTLRDIAMMGPHLGMTYDNISLIHSDLYPQQWYNDTFLGQNWTAVLEQYDGKSVK